MCLLFVVVTVKCDGAVEFYYYRLPGTIIVIVVIIYIIYYTQQYAACKAEVQQFNRSYSQQAFTFASLLRH